MKHTILHDTGKTLCFVGKTTFNAWYHHEFSKDRPSEVIRVEDLENKPQSWFDERQFINISADLPLKQKILAITKDKTDNWFSITSALSSIAPDVKIGRGVFIADLAFLHYDGVEIGDHSVVTNHVTISHHVRLGKFSYVCPHTYLGFCTIGQGTVVALRCSIFGTPSESISTPDWSNFVIDSRVNMTLTKSGTYQGHRLRSEDTSLTKRII